MPITSPGRPLRVELAALSGRPGADGSNLPSALLWLRRPPAWPTQLPRRVPRASLPQTSTKEPRFSQDAEFLYQLTDPSAQPLRSGSTRICSWHAPVYHAYKTGQKETRRGEPDGQRVWSFCGRARGQGRRFLDRARSRPLKLPAHQVCGINPFPPSTLSPMAEAQDIGCLPTSLGTVRVRLD